MEIVYSNKETEIVTKGQIVTYIDITKQMQFEFDVIIHSFPSGWASLLQCGKKNAQRQAGIWINEKAGHSKWKKSGFHTKFSTKAHWNYGARGTDPLQTGKEYHVKLEITESRMKLSVNGIVQYDEHKDEHQLSESIPCYVGGPWHSAADAEISNLLITRCM